MFCGGIWFVLGSIPNGAGTMVLRCFLFSHHTFRAHNAERILRPIDILPQIVANVTIHVPKTSRRVALLSGWTMLSMIILGIKPEKHVHCESACFKKNVRSWAQTRFYCLPQMKLLQQERWTAGKPSQLFLPLSNFGDIDCHPSAESLGGYTLWVRTCSKSYA